MEIGVKFLFTTNHGEIARRRTHGVGGRARRGTKTARRAILFSAIPAPALRPLRQKSCLVMGSPHRSAGPGFKTAGLGRQETKVRHQIESQASIETDVGF